MRNDWQIATPQPDLLGESPFWHPDEHMLYWLDIPGQQARRMNIFTAEVQSWAMPSEPGCMAPARSGEEKAGGEGPGVASGVVIALRDGVYRAQTWGGELLRLSPARHDTATTRFNDGKADPLGRFWFGSMYEPRTAALAELWSLDARPGQAPLLERKAGDATIANGLAWSPDAKTAYWTDTTAHTTWAWDWDASGNLLTNRRLFKQWPGKPEGWRPGAAGDQGGYGGRPDGAAVDVQGNYWVAMFEGARVVKLSPQGEVLAELALPAQCPTMPCFGGSDLKTLYVTTARQGRSAEELQAFPHSGHVFSLRVEVAGLPVNFFRD